MLASLCARDRGEPASVDVLGAAATRPGALATEAGANLHRPSCP
jgi:hypothetical protein